MDWSLVLLSQGIESTPELTPEGWVLCLEPNDHPRAEAILRQYRLENRGWPWQRPLPQVGFHWGSLGWCAVLALFYFADAISSAGLRQVGMMDPVAVQHGAWWRLFTATLLHFDLAHLAANVALGLPLFGLAMGRYGPGCALLAATLAGAAGNLAGLWLRRQEFHGLGASGMVMGALGLLAVQLLSIGRPTPVARKYMLSGVLGGLMLFTLLGLSPAADVIAHTGGFAAGLAFGAALAWLPQKKLLNRSVTAVCLAVLAALIAITWTLALSHPAS
jgi:rhomboid protease GluP